MGQLPEAVLNVREVLPVLEARGVKLSDFPKDVKLFQLPAWVGAAALKIGYRVHKPTRRIVDSVVSVEEMRAFCQDMLAEARLLGIPTPRLEKARPYFE